MQSSFFRHFRDYKWRRARLILCYDENQKIIAWGGIFKLFPNDYYGRIWLYVQRKHRRNGVGTTLYNKLREVNKGAMVCPWDERSKAFFYNLKYN